MAAHWSRDRTGAAPPMPAHWSRERLGCAADGISLVARPACVRAANGISLVARKTRVRRQWQLIGRATETGAAHDTTVAARPRCAPPCRIVASLEQVLTLRAPRTKASPANTRLDLTRPGPGGPSTTRSFRPCSGPPCPIGRASQPPNVGRRHSGWSAVVWRSVTAAREVRDAPRAMKVRGRRRALRIDRPRVGHLSEGAARIRTGCSARWAPQ